MPIQILPYVQSPLEQLTPYISQAAGEIGQGIKQRTAMGALQAYYNKGMKTSPISGEGKAGSPTQTSEPQQGSLQPLDVGKLYLTALNASGGDENYARQLVSTEIKKQEVEQKNINQIAKEDRALEREFQKEEQKPFFEHVASDKQNLGSAMQANEQVIDAILKGGVGPGSLPHIAAIARDLGVPKSITTSLESTDSKEFNNGVKQLMGRTIKDTFRGTTSQREIDIAESFQSEIGATEEANLAAAWAVQSDLMVRQERLRLYDEAREKGVPYSKIVPVVEKQLEPYRKQIKDYYFQSLERLRKDGVSKITEEFNGNK